MIYYIGIVPSSHLEHFGIKGQKWGVRRFQEEGGMLTPAGRERYGGINPNRESSELSKKLRGRETTYEFNHRVNEQFLRKRYPHTELNPNSDNKKKTGKTVAKVLAGAAGIAVAGIVINKIRSKNSIVSIEDYTNELLRKNMGKFNL